MKDLKGKAVAGGIRLGSAFVYDRRPAFVHRSIGAADVVTELTRLEDALRAAESKMADDEDALIASGESALAEITAAYRLLLDDATLLLKVRRLIQVEFLSAESAVQQGFCELSDGFAKIPDAYLRARGADVDTVAEAVLCVLLQTKIQPIGDIEPGSIIVGYRFDPLDILALSRAGAAGLVSEQGGAMSHAAITARANGITYVAGVKSATTHCKHGDRLIVDGTAGEVIIEADSATRNTYRQRAAKYVDSQRDLLATVKAPCIMRDGTRIRVMANVERLEDARKILGRGAEGIGLFRTEFLYLDGAGLPSEEEQYQDALSVIRVMGGRTATFRTLDFGGDKCIEGLDNEPGSNPALGMRGIRLMSTWPDVFRRQLRALYRASAHGPVRIMFPMVTGIDEFIRARALCDEVKTELLREGEAIDVSTRIGAMVETPAAALMTDRLAARADFMSLGTNDLAQYTLVADRDSKEVAHLYRPQSPAVLRLLQWSTNAARAAGKPMAVCGDMASDPRFAVLLIGMGVRELSCAIDTLPTVKAALALVDSRYAEQVAAQALELETSDEVDWLLDDRFASGGAMKELLRETSHISCPAG
jgi:phosphotransferase system enzyme I (PtsI)